MGKFSVGMQILLDFIEAVTWRLDEVIELVKSLSIVVRIVRLLTLSFEGIEKSFMSVAGENSSSGIKHSGRIGPTGMLA